MSSFDEPHVEAAVCGTAVGRGIWAEVLINAGGWRSPVAPASRGGFEMMAQPGEEETIAWVNGLITFLAARK